MAECLRLLLLAQGVEVPSLGTAFLDDVVDVAIEESEAVQEQMDELDRMHREVMDNR